MSHDEMNGIEDQDIFCETILSLPDKTKLYFMVYYSEWRKNVMSYARFRLDLIAEELRGEKPGYEDDEITREYVSLILPLVDEYRKELNN